MRVMPYNSDQNYGAYGGSGTSGAPPTAADEDPDGLNRPRIGHPSGTPPPTRGPQPFTPPTAPRDTTPSASAPTFSQLTEQGVARPPAPAPDSVVAARGAIQPVGGQGPTGSPPLAGGQGGQVMAPPPTPVPPIGSAPAVPPAIGAASTALTGASWVDAKGNTQNSATPPVGTPYRPSAPLVQAANGATATPGATAANQFAGYVSPQGGGFGGYGDPNDPTSQAHFDQALQKNLTGFQGSFDPSKLDAGKVAALHAQYTGYDATGAPVGDAGQAQQRQSELRQKIVSGAPLSNEEKAVALQLGYGKGAMGYDAGNPAATAFAQQHDPVTVAHNQAAGVGPNNFAAPTPNAQGNFTTPGGQTVGPTGAFVPYPGNAGAAPAGTGSPANSPSGNPTGSTPTGGTAGPVPGTETATPTPGAVANVPAPNVPAPAGTGAPGTIPGSNDPSNILAQLLKGVAGQGAGGATSDATQAAIQAQLKNPNAYNSDAVKQAYNWEAGNIDDRFSLEQKQLAEDMARRGLSNSTGELGMGGRLSDLNIAKRSARETLAEQLAQKMAESQQSATGQAIGQGLAGANSAQQNAQSWLGQLMGYGQQGFNNDVTTQSINNQQNQSYQDFLLKMLGLGYSGGATA